MRITAHATLGIDRNERRLREHGLVQGREVRPTAGGVWLSVIAAVGSSLSSAGP